MSQDIDQSLQSQSLLAELEKTDAGMALLLKQQEDIQQQKLALRRQQLRQRKLDRVQQEAQEKQLLQQVEQEELKQAEEKGISEQYVRSLFKLKQGTREQRMDLLSEYLQDQFTEELSALLTRQFLEKDARLKQVMLKYIE